MAEEVQQGQEAAEEKKQSGSGLKKMLMIWLPLFILQLVVAYIIVAKLFRPKLAPVTQVVQAEPVKKKSSKKAGKAGPIYSIEDVIVNPKNSFGKHFVNVTVALECENNKVVKELEKRDVQIRDFLISLLTERTIQEIDDAAEKDSLRSIIIDRVNEMLPDEGVEAVYFSNFIIQ